MAYKVKLDIFEGPFDLLVYLIENAEMNIYDIKVSSITSQYLNYLSLLQDYNIELASEFMVLAATLIEIKSKMLLPRPKIDGDESAYEDPRAELVQKIVEYKKFKTAAENLEQLEELGLKIYSKPQEDLSQYTKEPDEFIDLDLSQFVKAFNLFIQKKKKIEDIHKKYEKIEQDRVSVEDRMMEITALFKAKSGISFHDLISDNHDKYDIVLTFVSVLELIRLNTVSVRQHTSLGEIYLTLKKPKGSELHHDK